MSRLRTVALAAVLLVVSDALCAQHMPGMTHTPGMEHKPAVPPAPTDARAPETGQAGFAAIAEVVRLLEADSTTDWAKVNIEALRQHLIDMDAVTLRSRVRQTPVAGGVQIEARGDVAVAASLRRMVTEHASMLPGATGWRATAAPIPGGIRLTVLARDPTNLRDVARIRGLGFAGLMTQGAHHARHHLMIARGAGEHAHHDM